MFKAHYMQDVCNTMHDMMLVVERDTLRILFANHAAQYTLEYNQDTLLQHTLHLVLPKTEHSQLTGILNQLTSGSPQRRQEIWLTADDTPVAIEAQYSLGNIQDTDVIVCIGRDIRPQHRKEAVQAQFNTLYQKIIEKAPIGIFAYDLEGRVIMVNAAHLKINQTSPDMSPDDFIGMPLLEHNATITKNNLLDSLQQVLHGKPFERCVKNFEIRNQKIISVELRGVPLVDASNQIIGGVVLVDDITERVNAENKLRASEETTRTLLNVPTHTAILIDTSWNVLAINDLGAYQFGKTTDEIVGKSLFEITLPGNFDLRLDKAEECMRTEVPVNFESTIHGRELEQSIYPIFDTQGTVVRLALFSRDVTHHKQLVNDLRTQRQIANTLRQAGEVLTSTLELDEVFDRLLEQVGRVIPYDAANVMLIENNAASVVAHTGYDHFGLTAEYMNQTQFYIDQTPLMQKLINTRTPIVIADIQADPDWVPRPESRWVRSWIGAPIINRNQKLVGFFSLDSAQEGFYGPEHIELIIPFAQQAVIALENARLYEQLQKQKDRVAAQLTQLDALYNAGKSVLSTLKLDEILQRLAQEMTAIARVTSTIICKYDDSTQTGLIQSSYEMPGLPCAQALSNSSGVIHINTPRIQQAFEQRESLLLAHDELAEDFPDCPNQDLLYTAVLVPISNETTLSGFALLRDCRPDQSFPPDTLRTCEALANQAAIAIEQATLFRNIQELERVKSEMIRIASHDLRSPLTQIKGFITLLASAFGDTLPPDRREYFQLIDDAIGEMENIITNILSLKRIEARHKKAEPVIWDEIIHDSVKAMQAEAKAKNHTIHVEVPPGLPQIQGDPVQLKRALTNLIGNAIKYTPPAGHIYVRAFPKDYGGRLCVAVEVEDTGIGIVTEQQSELFRPFYRACQPGTEDIPGTGLGLSVVKSAIEYHNGNVYVDSEPGRGSIFGFWVPVQT